MKRRTIVVFSLLSTLSATAQEVVSSQGESYSNVTGSIDFTIGEVVINTETSGAGEITQGFHQTNWNILSVEDHAPSYEVTIFPNPMEDVLSIETSKFDNVTYTLYDAQGKMVMQNKLSAEQTPIQVGQLVQGAYTLELNYNQTNQNSLSSPKRKIYKLVKIH